MGNSLEVIRGACGHDCPDTCAWLVEVEDGDAKSLVGDPEHPFTRGGLCFKVNHYLEERVYHPDRVLYPLKRVGPKGLGKFERISWDEALSDISQRWKRIINEYGAEAILPFSFAGNQGLIQCASIDRRLFATLGASCLDRTLCGDVASAGLIATQGTPIGIDPEDIVHSRFIILWGTNTIVTNLHLWPYVREAQQKGARVVVVDPVRTRTAEAADWHIAPRPGSDAALALGMMHIIIRDRLVDQDYVDCYSTGFAELSDRARQYPPSRVAEITGILADEIERFAREYAVTQPSLIRPLIGMEHHQNGAMMFRTISCLPILTGAWRHRGGGLARSTHALQFSTLNLEALYMPELEQSRRLNMQDLGDILCTDLDPPVKALFVYNCNPAVFVPNQQRVIEGLKREDVFTVVHDLFNTETARYADYLLPATSQVESLDLVPAWGHHYLSLNRPAIEPRGESVSNTEMFRRLAAALEMTEAYLFESDEELLKTALNSDHPFLNGITWQRLWEDGYVKLNQPEDWRPFAEGGFATKSGKAELYSQTLKEAGHDPLPAHTWDPPRNGYGLQLITGKVLHFLNSSYSHFDRHQRAAKQLFIEINPADASARSLKEDDLVRVFNEFGELTMPCRISNRVRPGIAWMPFGWLFDHEGQPRSANAITPTIPTDWGGGSAFYDAFVEVEAIF